MALDVYRSGSSSAADEFCWPAPRPLSDFKDRPQVPPHLFEEWPGVRQRLRSAWRIVLLLDFDGTLAPIRSHPADVTLDPETRSGLERLAGHQSVAIAIITGRRVADIRQRVGVPGIEYLGVHGWEGPNGCRMRPATLQLMRRARQFLERPLSGLEGVWIEDKGPALTVHYRKAEPASVPWARIAVQALIRVFKPDLRMISGKKAWEIFPSEFPGKCGAVEVILAGRPADTLPIWVGDDAADEAVFRFLQDGLTVRVGRKARTYAQYRLAGPSEVREFLERIDTEIARRLQAAQPGSRALLT